MKKKWMALTMIILVLCISGVQVFAAENAAIKDACNGVVRIIAVDGQGNLLGHGSGFAVGVEGQKVDTFVTNNHVIKEAAQIYVVMDYIGEGGTWIEASVLKTWTVPDLAIISIQTPLDKWKPLVLKPAGSLSATEEVYALGFPGVADALDDLGLVKYPSESKDVTITKGIVSKAQVMVEETNCIQTDAEINSGNSGGPLMTEDGCVVGINTVGIQNSGGSTYGINGAIYIDYAMDALDELGISYIAAEGAENSRAKEPFSDSSVQTANGSQESKNTSGAGIVITVAAVILAAGAAVFIYLWRKKTVLTSSGSIEDKSVLMMERTMPVQGPAAGSVRITGINGSCAGQSFPLGKGIIIGRDPARCNVVLPKDTGGVSAVHCEIRKTNEGIMLTDKASSYGTYVKNMERLTPDVPYSIHVGDTFCLGSGENAFRLEG